MGYFQAFMLILLAVWVIILSVRTRRILGEVWVLKDKLTIFLGDGFARTVSPMLGEMLNRATFEYAEKLAEEVRCLQEQKAWVPIGVEVVGLKTSTHEAVYARLLLDPQTGHLKPSATSYERVLVHKSEFLRRHKDAPISLLGCPRWSRVENRDQIVIVGDMAYHFIPPQE